MQNNQFVHRIDHSHQLCSNNPTNVIKINPINTSQSSHIDQTQPLFFNETSENSSTLSQIKNTSHEVKQFLYDDIQQDGLQVSKLTITSQAMSTQKSHIKATNQSSSNTMKIKKINSNIKFIQQKIISFSGESCSSQEQQNSKDYHHQNVFKSNNLKDIIYRSITKHKMVQCVVKVESNFWQRHTKIKLYLKEQKKLLLTAKKNKLNLSSYFQITGSSTNKNIYGFIQSSLTRKEYKIYKFKKNSQNDRKQSENLIMNVDHYSQSVIKLQPVQVNDISIYQSGQLGYIAYQNNIFGIKQEKALLLIPKIKISQSQIFSDLKYLYQKRQYDRLSIFSSKFAQVNKEGKRVLDFKSEKVVSSSKNMIIENQFGEICLSFYKYKEDVYMLNIMWPLNILHGFFIAITNIDKHFL